MNPQSIIADIATEYVGTKEDTKNRGLHLHDFWSATSYPDGDVNREPWCSAFVAFCVKLAMSRNPALRVAHPPDFPAVAQWIPWARSAEVGCCVIEPRYGLPQRGDIVIFRFSHVGIVAGFQHDGWVPTIEGNTNQEGEREGDGVWAKKRGVGSIAAFIRLPVKASADMSE